MGNIAQWLREAEESTGERIGSICVGEHYSDHWNLYEGEQPRNAEQLNRLLTRDEGLSVLDVEYDNGFGGADCFPMYAWSPSWVYFIAEYDGSTGLSRVPRMPVDCKPEFDGDY